MAFKYVTTASSPVLSRIRSPSHPTRSSDLVGKTVSSKQSKILRQNTTQIFLNPNPSLPIKLRINLIAEWLDYGLHDRGSNPEGEEIFSFSKMSRFHSVFYLLTPHFILEEKWLEHKVHHTHLQREPRLRMSGPILVLPNIPSLRGQGFLPLDIYFAWKKTR